MSKRSCNSRYAARKAHVDKQCRTRAHGCKISREGLRQLCAVHPGIFNRILRSKPLTHTQMHSVYMERTRLEAQAAA